MISLLFGLLLLIVVVQALRWYAKADVKAIKNSLRWVLIGLGLVVVVFLAATGKIGAALTGLAALMAWAFRIMSMLHMGRQFGGMFRSFGFGRGFGAGRGPQASQVDSAYLKMKLDHATGAMDGEVTQGRFQGRRLASMSQDDLILLMQDVQADQDSIGLLEAYLDRTHPDWRGSAAGEGTASGGATPSTAMSVEEAYRILGLNTGASDAEIKSAYRRLMGQLHPDHGGTDYLAAKVNQAKDFLLKKGGSA